MSCPPHLMPCGATGSEPVGSRTCGIRLAQDSIGPVQQHKGFIEMIRESVWSRIEVEDELPPSLDALWCHWQ